MKSLSNLRNIIPRFFNKFIDHSAAIKIVHLHENVSDFLLVTHQNILDMYVINRIKKPDPNKKADESDLVVEAIVVTKKDYENVPSNIIDWLRKDCNLHGFEGYMVYRFGLELGLKYDINNSQL